jgi:phage gpG-like protein
MKIEVNKTEDNVQEVLDAMDKAVFRALTIIGLKLEKYAKALCPVGTSESTGIKGYRGGTLRNSITYEVQEDTVAVGTNVEYAPYVELGTGPYFKAPPDWEQFTAPQGGGVGKGYVHPRPYLRPAVEDHLTDYKDVIESELKNA